MADAKLLLQLTERLRPCSPRELHETFELFPHLVVLRLLPGQTTCSRAFDGAGLKAST